MTAVRNLIIRGGADFSSLRNEMRRAQKNVQDFKSSVQGAVGKIGLALGAVGFGAMAADAARTAMDVEASMQQISRLMGNNAHDFMKWSETQATAFNMSKANAVKYGAIFGNLTSTFSDGAEDTKDKTIDLLKASAVTASGTGRTMEDVMWRIRSGLLGNTEAIEDLGINVYVNMLKSTQAFRQFAGDKSWDQLDFKTQQLIRYYGILEQANKKFGVSVNDNTNSSLQAFQAALGNVKLALGNAFLPILGWILPILTRMANALYRVMNIFAQFMMALFGYKVPAIKVAKTSNTAAAAVDGLGDAYKKTGGKAKKAAKAIKEVNKNQRGLAGFDELNILASPDSGKSDSGAGDTGGGGGGGGGGAGDGISTPMPDVAPMEGSFTKISKKIKEMAERFKKFIAPAVAAFKAGWNAVVDYLKEKGAQIKEFWKANGGQFAEAMKNVWNFLKPILKWLLKFIWESIKGAIDGVLQVFEGIIQFISGVFTGDWKKAWEGIKDIFMGLIKAIWNIMNLMLFKSILTGLGKLILSFAKGFIKVVKNIKIPFNGIESWFAKVGTKMWEKVSYPFKAVYTWFRDNVLTKIVTVFDNFRGSIGTKAEAIWNAVKSKFSGGYTWFRDNVVYKLRDVLVDFKNTIATKAANIWIGIKNKFAGGYNWFKTSVVNPLSNVLSDFKQTIVNKAVGIWIGIKNAFGGAYAWFRDNVAGKIADALANIKRGFQNGVGDGLKAVLNTFIGMFNSAINSFNRFKNQIPFGDKIGNIPNIPRLAQGGYVGANKPLLAMIGDNRNEGEIVAPESKIYEQVMKALNKGGSGSTELVVNIGGTTVFRKLIDGINDAQRKAGKTLINV